MRDIYLKIKEAIMSKKDLKNGDDQKNITNDRNKTLLNWMVKNRTSTEPIEKEFGIYLEKWLATKKSHPDEQIVALTEFINYLKHIEILCEQKGKDYTRWFNEYLVKDNYIERREKQLDSLIKNYESKCKRYEKNNVDRLK